jgi:hypothetical protein
MMESIGFPILEETSGNVRRGMRQFMPWIRAAHPSRASGNGQKLSIRPQNSRAVALARTNQ